MRATTLTDPGFDIEIRVLSQPRYSCVIRAAVEAAVQRLGFGEEQCARVMLAVDEAVTNVMRHGYENQQNQPIWVKLRPTDHHGNAGFTIVVEDLARQVEPDAIRGRDLKDVRPGGLGVHIIKQVMDHAQYTKREGGGMRLTMAKTATGSPSNSKQESSTP